MADACIRRLDVELYSTGDVSAAAAAGLEEHLHSCPSCSAYLAKLKKEREEFLRAHSFAELLSAGVADSRGERWYERLKTALSFPALRPVLAPVAVLLVAIVVVPFIIKPAGNDIRYKGAPCKDAPALSYIYKRVIFLLIDGDRWRIVRLLICVRVHWNTQHIRSYVRMHFSNSFIESVVSVVNSDDREEE